MTKQQRIRKLEDELAQVKAELTTCRRLMFTRALGHLEHELLTGRAPSPRRKRAGD